MKIDDYTPTEEEKKIVLKSNMLFLTIYGSATVAGFGLGVGITHLRKKPFKSFRTMLSIFMYGVTGELVGRYLGQYTAMQSLKVNLPLQSELRGIMFKNENVIKVQRENESNVDDLAPQNTIPVQSKNVKYNAYGDILE